jgi:DNA (cytosine-5)-methyltransferase 1
LLHSQGFSGCNRYKKANDNKNTLIPTSLSYVEHYRPAYFLLENVKDLCIFKLGGTQATKAKISGGIKGGVMKWILKALTSLGYVEESLNIGKKEKEKKRKQFFIDF